MKIDDTLLSDVVAETLEQFAFLFGEPGDTPAISPGSGPYLEARITFTGGHEKGTLLIAAPESLCREMAGNILGMDEDEVTRDVSIDAIKELSNVLIGLVTARRLGPGIACALHSPEAIPTDHEKVKELAARPGAVCMNVEDQPFVAVLEEEDFGD